jgi:hypothetical protein
VKSEVLRAEGSQGRSPLWLRKTSWKRVDLDWPRREGNSSRVRIEEGMLGEKREQREQ